MYNLLICDDEKDIVNALKIYLSDPSYELYTASNGEEALRIVEMEDIHLVLMDIMMPVKDGMTALSEIRKISNVPVIFLTAKSEDTDKILGLNIGADDYITKPFNPVEVCARVRSHLRRYFSLGGGNVKPETFVCGGIELNDASKKVTVDGEPVTLTPKEYDLLFYLVENKNIALSRDKLLSDIWGYDFFGDDRTIDTHIKNLRNNLGPYRDFIVTLRGVGYKFEYEG